MMEREAHLTDSFRKRPISTGTVLLGIQRLTFGQSFGFGCIHSLAVLTREVLEGEDLQVSNDTADRLLLIQAGIDHPVQMADSFESFGFTIQRVTSIQEAFSALKASPSYKALLLQYRNGSREALDCSIQTIASLRSEAASIPLLLLADSLSYEKCRQLIEIGVNGIVSCRNGQPDMDSLATQLAGLTGIHSRRNTTQEPDCDRSLFDVTGIVGCSRAMGDVLRRVSRASQISDVPILIYGESGTGKQLLAEAIHRLDPKRSRNHFISVNCAAIAGTLADSALFGHRKGAYTGATDDRLGCFRSAEGGTILLDEIGELDLALQPRLLRVLQESLVLPVGDDQECPVDVRVIAATNRRLEVLVEKKLFRLDLFQRLNVITIEIPPLRERAEDIPHLAEFFLKQYADYAPIPVRGLESSAIEALCAMPFKGNVRELENLIRRALAFKSNGSMLTADDLLDAASAMSQVPPGPAPLVRDVVESATHMLESGSADFDDLIGECEKRLLDHIIRHSDGSQADLARELGLTRRTLYNKRRKYGLL